jgi:predicted transcriptional regulator
MNQPQPKNRNKGLKRAERSIKEISGALEQLKARNNCTIEQSGLSVFTATFVTRLLNVTFAEMQFEGFTDRNLKAKTYYYILAGLLIQGRPVTKTYIINYLGLSFPASDRIIKNLIASGYISETKAGRAENLKGRFIYKKYEHGIMITGKGLDKLTFINSLLTDKRLF